MNPFRYFAVLAAFVAAAPDGVAQVVAPARGVPEGPVVSPKTGGDVDRAIASHEVIGGMTANQVMRALGAPDDARSVTPPPDARQVWRYDDGPDRQRLVFFAKGVVVDHRSVVSTATPPSVPRAQGIAAAGSAPRQRVADPDASGTCPQSQVHFAMEGMTPSAVLREMGAPDDVVFERRLGVLLQVWKYDSQEDVQRMIIFCGGAVVSFGFENHTPDPGPSVR